VSDVGVVTSAGGGPDFCRKSFNVRFLPYLLENSFGSLLAENL